MSELRIGVIGAWGFRGRLARYAEEQYPEVRVVAGADAYQEALDAFRGFYGGDLFTTTDYRELLSRRDVDAVFVCSPDYCHEEHAVAALEAGKAVYLEKPLAITIEGCDRVLEAAYRSGAKLYLGHNMRYFPVIMKMKELIDDGAIGELRAVWCRHFVSIGGDAYFKDWHSERKNVTGLLLQKGAHDIDVIHWLAGAYTHSVVGMGNLSVYNRCARRKEGKPSQVELNVDHWPPLTQTGMSPVIDVEDHSMILMQLANGVQASYLQCHYTPDYVRNYTFIGTEGKIENIGDTGACRIHLYNRRCHELCEPDKVYPLEEVSGSHGGSDPQIVKAFIRFLRDGTPPNTSPVAARYAVAAGVMGSESLRTDNGLRIVPPLNPKLEQYFRQGQTR